MKTKTTQSLGKRKRLPSLRRVASDELPGFRLTLRDIGIIKAIYDYRALTAPQIAALFFHADGDREVNARCKHRLRMLYHHGYVFRDEQPSKLSEGRKPLVYFLDSRGAEFLTGQLGEAIQWDRKDNKVSWPFLDHLLATNDVRIAVCLAAVAQGLKINGWVDDKALKSAQMKDLVAIRGEEGGIQKAAVVPDGYFVLDAGEYVYHHFLEIDRRTVTGEATSFGSRDWARKVRAYLEYYHSGKYEKRYGTKSLRVMTITTGERRMAHLREITKKIGRKGDNALFWFTTFEHATTAQILTEPIWQRADKDGLHCLVW